MELKTFVTETLNQILSGIYEARKSEHGWAICTEINANSEEATKLKTFLTRHRQPIFNIDFNVAVTVEKGTDTKGTIEVLGGFLKLASGGESNSSNNTINRVKFSVPIQMPNEHYKPQKSNVV